MSNDKFNIADKLYSLLQKLTSKKPEDSKSISETSAGFTTQYDQDISNPPSFSLSEGESQKILDGLQNIADKTRPGSADRKLVLQAQLGALNYLAWKLKNQWNETPISKDFINNMLDKRESLKERVGDQLYVNEFRNKLPGLKGLRPELLQSIKSDSIIWISSGSSDNLENDWDKLSGKKPTYDID